MSARSLAQRLAELLRKRGADDLDVELLLRHRGISSHVPESLASLGSGGGNVSYQRVGFRVNRVTQGAVARLASRPEEPDFALFVSDVSAALNVIAEHAPRAVEHLQDAVSKAIDLRLNVLNRLDDADPAVRERWQRIASMGRVESVIRIADLLGLPSQIKLTQWKYRPKYEDAKRTRLYTPRSARRTEQVLAICNADGADLSVPVLKLGRDISRSAGVVGAARLAAIFSDTRGVPLSPQEAVALLEPFAVQLGRGGGDDWFVFMNYRNDFATMCIDRTRLVGEASFEALLQSHRRESRGLWAGNDHVPLDIIGASLALYGLVVQGDKVTMGKRGKGAVVPDDPITRSRQSVVRQTLVNIFHQMAKSANTKWVPRNDFNRAVAQAGLNEVSARLCLTQSGLFDTTRHRVWLIADGAETQEAAQAPTLPA